MFEIYYEINGLNHLSSVIIDATDEYVALLKFRQAFVAHFGQLTDYRIEKIVNLSLVKS